MTEPSHLHPRWYRRLRTDPSLTGSRDVTVIPTIQNTLLHLNLVEFIGTNDDAVAGEVDAAARLERFNLLRDEEKEH